MRANYFANARRRERQKRERQNFFAGRGIKEKLRNRQRAESVLDEKAELPEQTATERLTALLSRRA